MRNLYFTLLLLLLPLFAFAQTDTTTTKKKFIFSGGMMLHIGYQGGKGCGFLDDATGQEQTLHSLTYGIGGQLRFHLMEHMHIGTEGYVSTMPLNRQGKESNIRTGWGGILCGYYTTFNRLQLMAGGTLGGGAQRSLHVFHTNEQAALGDALAVNAPFDDFSQTREGATAASHPQAETPIHSSSFAKKSFFVFDPYMALEYALTQRIHLIFKLDYLIAVHQQQFLTPSGPRLYVGFMFCH